MDNQNCYTLEELLKEFKVQIPPLQRDYAFGRENENEKRENFIESIKNALLEDGPDRNPLHLDLIYGTEKNGRLFLLDGQQRITTLWLVAVYLTKRAEMDEINYEKIENLEKFSYDTRISSREFCKAIFSENWSSFNWEPKTKNENNLDEKWIFNEWEYDSTIKGMITMLKSIDNIFYKDFFKERKSIDVRGLMSKIDFSFFKLDEKEIGDPEDLYVKMNARGKQLSDWDHFKVKLDEYIDDKKFKELIDTELIDLFWEITNKDVNTDVNNVIENTEKGILKLFKSAIKVETIIKEHDKCTTGNDKKVNQLVEDDWKDNIDLVAIQKFWQFLKNEKEKEKDKKDRIELKEFARFDNPGLRIDELYKSLHGSGNENMTPNELSLFAAYYLFIKYRVNSDDFKYDEDDLKQTIRVISNYQGKNESTEIKDAIDNITDIKNILKDDKKSILEILKDLEDKENIEDLNLLAKKIKEKERKMPSQNVQNNYEEKLKAKMLTSNTKEEWGKIIYKCEKNPFSKGSAKWLLEISKEDREPNPNLDNANKYYKMLFDEKNNLKIDFEKEVILLSYVDKIYDFDNGYFPLGNKPNSKDYSWWRVFRNANFTDDLSKGLRKFLDYGMNKKPENDWRQWYIKAPDLLDVYQTVKFNYSSDWGNDFVIKGHGNGNSKKYLLQLESLKNFFNEKYKPNEDNKIKTTSSTSSKASLFGYIGKGEKDYRYKITYEFPENVKQDFKEKYPNTAFTNGYIKNHSELRLKKQFVIYPKNEKDKEKFITKGDSVSGKLEEVAKYLNEVTQNNL